MSLPRHERKKKIAEMSPLIRIFSVLFVSICLINTLPQEALLYGSFLENIAIQFAAVLTMLYLATLGLESLRSRLAGAEPIYFDYITLTVSLLIISLIYFASGGNKSPYKILYLPTILFYTVRFGRNWGLAAAGITAFILTAANTIAVVQHKALNLELDIIYMGIFFLTSWLVGSMVDMERSISDRLSRQVNVDDLTGLFSYRYLREELKRRTDEEPAAAFTLMLASLDHFRYYYETRGHQEGNRLLFEIAENMLETVGNSGEVFRFGGDGFAVIVDHADREKVLSLAESIRDGIKINFTISAPEKYLEYDIGASLGLSFYPADGSTCDDLISTAEQALYRARVIDGSKIETYFSVLEFLKAQIDASEEEAFNKLSAFLAIINARDQYTFGHSERVLIYASIIATLLGMPPPAKKHLQYGAYLHDIGKIEIDRAILNKPGKLDDAEWGIISQHPLWGADIARNIKALHPAVPAILYHHERYDGAGYPFRLSGKGIPLEGRIMALADSFDAMTVERPYSKAFSYAEAIAELKENSQTQFDPDMVELFTGFLERRHSIEQILTFKMKEKYLL